MNYKWLEAFITVAEQGSFSKAAQLLYTSPTALTQQLNALERYLQCAVFERTYRGVRLTPAGETFYQYAKEIMQLSDRAVLDCRTKAGILDNKIVIASYREMEMNELRPYLGRFAEVCPDIEIRFLSENYRIFFDLLKNREIDLFIHPRDPYIEKKGFHFQKIGVTTICCNMLSTHSLASRERLSIADLRGESIIVSCGCKSRSLDNLIDHLKANEPDVRLKAFSSDDEIWTNVFTRNYLMIGLAYSNRAPNGCVSIELDWPEIIEYGFIHRTDDSVAVRRFLSYMKSIRAGDL